MTRNLTEAFSVLRKASKSSSSSISTSKDRMTPRGESFSDLNTNVQNVTRQNNLNGIRNLDTESELESKLKSSISVSARVRKGYSDEGGALFSWDTAYRSLSADPTKRRARSAHPRSIVQSTVTLAEALPASSSSSVIAQGAVKEKARVRSVKCRGTSTSSSRARASAADEAMSGSKQPHRPSRSHSPQDGRHRHPYVTVYNALEGLTSMGGSRANRALMRGDFIPGGCTDGKEFNAYANSSKIAKAAVYHNAALSTR